MFERKVRHQSALTVLHARCDLGEQCVTFGERPVALANFAERANLRDVYPTEILENSCHGNKVHRLFELRTLETCFWTYYRDICNWRDGPCIR